MPDSPSILNYYIGKGSVFIKTDADVDFRHVGNVPTFEWTPEIETLQHNSSQFGVRVQDREIVLEKRGTVRIVFEEFTPENLAIAMLGTVGTNTDGDPEVDIFSANSITAQVRFVGNNDVGPRLTMNLNNVTFNPTGTVPLINEELGQIELEGRALVDTLGKFGTIALTAEEATA